MRRLLAAALLSLGACAPPGPSPSGSPPAHEAASPSPPAGRAGLPEVKPRPSSLPPEAYERRVASVKARAGKGFSVVVEPPFVVVGDGGEEQVKRVAEGTVRWAVDRLQGDFFARGPDEVLEVWLFDGAASYEKNAERLFGKRPDTPYGYFSAEHGALVMNIATGGGTLVHEIVHPFVRANAPGAPAWLNEGLASLYEASTDEGGHIRGMLNWRLPALQKAARRRALVPLARLVAMDDDAFYGDESGRHYAEARYLMYYLQERAVLVRFVQRWLSQRRADPTGEKTLLEVTGEASLESLQAAWEPFVLGLG